MNTSSVRQSGHLGKGSSLEDVRAILRKQLPPLRQRFGIKSLMIFGSCARGEQSRRSDLDILVEFEEDQPLTLIQFIALENDLSSLTGRKVDLVEKSALKPAIGRRILAEAIPI